jgi:hypothetical protein
MPDFAGLAEEEKSLLAKGGKNGIKFPLPPLLTPAVCVVRGIHSSRPKSFSRSKLAVRIHKEHSSWEKRLA